LLQHRPDLSKKLRVRAWSLDRLAVAGGSGDRGGANEFPASTDGLAIELNQTRMPFGHPAPRFDSRGI
jgi:hypothetical protein